RVASCGRNWTAQSRLFTVWTRRLQAESKTHFDSRFQPLVRPMKENWRQMEKQFPEHGARAGRSFLSCLPAGAHWQADESQPMLCRRLKERGKGHFRTETCGFDCNYIFRTTRPRN